MSYVSKIHHDGPDELVVESGNSILAALRGVGIIAS